MKNKIAKRQVVLILLAVFIMLSFFSNNIYAAKMVYVSKEVVMSEKEYDSVLKKEEEMNALLEEDYNALIKGEVRRSELKEKYENKLKEVQKGHKEYKKFKYFTPTQSLEIQKTIAMIAYLYNHNNSPFVKKFYHLADFEGFTLPHLKKGNNVVDNAPEVKGLLDRESINMVEDAFKTSVDLLTELNIPMNPGSFKTTLEAYQNDEAEGYAVPYNFKENGSISIHKGRDHSEVLSEAELRNHKAEIISIVIHEMGHLHNKDAFRRNKNVNLEHLEAYNKAVSDVSLSEVKKINNSGLIMRLKNNEFDDAVKIDFQADWSSRLMEDYAENFKYFVAINSNYKDQFACKNTDYEYFEEFKEIIYNHSVDVSNVSPISSAKLKLGNEYYIYRDFQDRNKKMIDDLKKLDETSKMSRVKFFELVNSNYKLNKIRNTSEFEDINIKENPEYEEIFKAYNGGIFEVMNGYIFPEAPLDKQILINSIVNSYYNENPKYNLNLINKNIVKELFEDIPEMDLSVKDIIYAYEKISELI